MRKITTVLVLCLSLILLSACGSSDETSSGDSDSGSGNGSKSKLAELKDKGTVTVGFANEKPYAYKEDGELKGEAVAIAKEIFKNLGVDKMKGKLADFGQLIPGLKAGQFDVITAGMAIQPKRCEEADFGEPELKYGEGIVVQKGNPKDIHSYEDIANNSDINVSVMSGATEIGFLKSQGVSEKQINQAPDIPATFSAIQSGRADVTTATEMTLKMAVESADQSKLEFVTDFEQPDVEGVPSYGAAAFSKDSDELRKAYNKELKKLKDNGKLLELVKPSGFGERNLIKKDLTTEDLCKG
ncbi:ectoine/hydroxyectoine ABC transporter substrate-binding protein EhuB [Tuberibacillus sp. Marseille-P3662]|uniref:ectoine/hydroxyectoine ABC transporter substrate-binding protein EhuB n=1 Tax=Tuberibacillus sp. Marseille-P3662 TaxID=1965358 RepID=UPI000A1CCEE8|nr:ectoine/hydroxyectoine ABC transporter substrate-binding protein EhuB [Tuberibacillus sp. Marseille-P3662]